MSRARKRTWFRIALGAASLGFAVSAIAGPAAIEKWHHEEDDDAKKQPEKFHIAEHCGHPIALVIDWKGFEMADWSSKSVAGYCADPALDAVSYECTVPEYKKALASLKTVTCHYKKCEELPYAFKDTPRSGPGYEYKLTGKASNLDISFCVKTTVQDDSIIGRAWLEKNL